MMPAAGINWFFSFQVFKASKKDRSGQEAVKARRLIALGSRCLPIPVLPARMYLVYLV